MSDEVPILVPMPSLVSLLLRAERLKGSPLTREQVLAIRDGCTCVAMPPAAAAALARDRGYDDVDPEQCWEQWQQVRHGLIDTPSKE